MKRKFLSLLLVGAMTATMLVGCGSSGNDTGSTDGSANVADEEEDGTAADDSADASDDSDSTISGGKLTLYAWDPNFNIPAIRAAADDYKANVNADFELEIVEQSQSADVEQAITLAGSSGDYSTLPDIVLFQDHYIQNFVSDYPDAWMSIDDIGIDWSDFASEKLDYSTINGTHYGVPVDNGTVIFAYRVDVLGECGYTIEDVTGITWERFIEIGEEVYEKTGKYLLSMDGDGNDMVYMMLQAEGQSQFKDGKPCITENETVVQIVELVVEMVQKNVLYLANNWSDYVDKTIIGDMVAGVMNGNWIIPSIEQVEENSGKWEITSMPTLSGSEGYASNGGSSLYITSNCQNVDLAKDFLKYTFGGSTGTYDAALQNAGLVTTCISAGESDVYGKGVEYFNNTPIYAQIVEMGAKVPVIEQSDYHYNIRTYMAAAIVKIQNGKDVMEALKEAEDQIKFEMGL